MTPGLFLLAICGTVVVPGAPKDGWTLLCLLRWRRQMALPESDETRVRKELRERGKGLRVGGRFRQAREVLS